jgi:hypothetical protein
MSRAVAGMTNSAYAHEAIDPPSTNSNATIYIRPRRHLDIVSDAPSTPKETSHRNRQSGGITCACSPLQPIAPVSRDQNCRSWSRGMIHAQAPTFDFKFAEIRRCGNEHVGGRSKRPELDDPARGSVVDGTQTLQPTDPMHRNCPNEKHRHVI